MFLRTMSALLVSGIAFSSLAYAMEEDPVEKAIRQLAAIRAEQEEQHRQLSAAYVQKTNEIAANQKTFRESLIGMTIEQKRAALQQLKDRK